MSQRKRARKAARREVRSAQRVLRRQGATARLERVRMAVKDPTFQSQLLEAISFAEVLVSLRSVDQVRDLALKVLGEMGIDTDGVTLLVTLDPPSKQLGLRAVHTIEAAQAALAKAKEMRAPL